jgi:hypothetical protein
MDWLKKLITEVGVFEYELRPAELVWAALNGAAAYIISVTTMPVDERDWETYALALAAAAVRPVIAILFGKRPQ